MALPSKAKGVKRERREAKMKKMSLHKKNRKKELN
jgi:hypothetical protein